MNGFHFNFIFEHSRIMLSALIVEFSMNPSLGFFPFLSRELASPFTCYFHFVMKSMSASGVANI